MNGDEICAELLHVREDPALHDLVQSSWAVWCPQPKCTVHERQGVYNAVPQPSQTDRVWYPFY